MTFDITKPATLRDGRKVRILCTDGPLPGYPIMGIIEGSHEVTYWGEDGGLSARPDGPQPADLVNVATKREGWVNVYPPRAAAGELAEGAFGHGYIWSTQVSAVLGAAKYDRVPIATVRIEWDEP